MQHLITPYAQQIKSHAIWENEFTPDELNLLQQQAINSTQQAVVGGNLNSEETKKIRRSKVSWINKSNETFWIYEKLSHVVSSINAEFFQFDLTGFGEPIQLTNYDHTETGMYEWHQDYNAKVSRKLSLVLQLTDPSEYEGGNLQIMTHGIPETVRKRRGLISVFPSYTLHQVTPVTSGSRQSLVAWITGPKFK